MIKLSAEIASKGEQSVTKYQQEEKLSKLLFNIESRGQPESEPKKSMLLHVILHHFRCLCTCGMPARNPASSPEVRMLTGYQHGTLYRLQEFICLQNASTEPRIVSRNSCACIEASTKPSRISISPLCFSLGIVDIGRFHDTLLMEPTDNHHRYKYHNPSLLLNQS